MMRGTGEKTRAPSRSRRGLGARFHRDILAMCDQMDELYSMLLTLPDSIELLTKSRDCDFPGAGTRRSSRYT
jgi:hypothetical protein